MKADEQRALLERLETLRDLGQFGSWRDFATALGLGESYFTSKTSQLRSGSGSSISGPAAEALIRECAARGLTVSLSWIMRGEGQGPGGDRTEPTLARAYVPDPGHARPGDAEAWRTLEDDPVFSTFARGRLAVAATPLDREQTTAALNYAARRLPRNYGGGEAELAEVRRLYREGLAIVRDEDLVELPPKVPERAAPTPPPAAPRLTMKEKAAALAAKKGGRR